MPKQYASVDELGTETINLIGELRDLRKQQAWLEDEIKTIRERIMQAMKSRQFDAVAGPGFRVTISIREYRRVVPEKLVGLGIDPAIIQQATDFTRYEVLDLREDK